MPNRVNPPLPTRTLAFARELRSNETDAEVKLWRHLRSSRVAGVKFRRQYPVPPYVIDFYCAALKLGIELDGYQHSQFTDAERTRVLLNQGIELLRFWDGDVLNNTDAVLEEIFNSIQYRTLTPTPLPAGEGLKRGNQ